METFSLHKQPGPGPGLFATFKKNGSFS